jgi:hypothetical protein
MLLIAIAWLYVALMMAVAESTHPQGSLLGAGITFLLYGVAPLALVLYLVGTPTRRRARHRAEAAAAQESAARQAERGAGPQAAAKPGSSAVALDPDRGGHATATAEAGGVPPVREEP